MCVTFITPLGFAPIDSLQLKTPRSVFQDGSGSWPPCTPRRRQTARRQHARPPQPACASAYQPRTDAAIADTHTADAITRSRHSSARATLVDRMTPVNATTHTGRPCALSARAGKVQGVVCSTGRQLAHAARHMSNTHDSPAPSVALPVSFQAVSRPLELSLQSSLQLSLTVLVRYRSHGNI